MSAPRMPVRSGSRSMCSSTVAGNYAEYHDDPAISADAIAAIYGVDAALVKRFPVASLNMVKISYPRTTPQGGVHERDMHSGQQFVPLLELRLR